MVCVCPISRWPLVVTPVAAASIMTRLLPWAVAGVATAAMFAMGVAWFRAAVPAPVAMFVIPPLKTSSDIWQLSISGSRQALPLLQSSFAEAHAQFSPDGRWLAYTSTESGAAEVLVQSTSPGGGKWVVSSGGGNAPRWRGDSGAPGKATIVVVLNWMNGLKP